MPENEEPNNRLHRLLWRERALRETRLQLHQLQIEVHRVKADLARLECENESALAQDLASDLHAVHWDAPATEPAGTPRNTTNATPVAAAAPAPRPAVERVTFPAPRDRRENGKLPHQSAPLITTTTSKTAPAAATSTRRATGKQSPRRRSKKSSPAWVASLALHALVLLAIAPLSYVIITQEKLPLFASIFGPEEFTVEDPGNAPIELVSYENFEAPSDVVDAVADLPAMNADFGPLENELTSEAASSFGQLNTLPTDVGTLLAGGGGGGSGRGLGGGGGRGAAGEKGSLGEANFFGTPARANRVVFLVDNSGSMKQGRMETTLLELARSVESLGDKQEFYVVFYSDQAYPMFYPASEMQAVPATRANKERFFQWLQTVELCVGGALLKAVEIAESLDPQVVYVLSDGNITSARTLTELTRPGARKFTLHTLGMGVAKPQDAQNLAAIAAAHRGAFQMVRPLPAAVQMAKARPIRSNTFGVAWGAGSLQPVR